MKWAVSIDEQIRYDSFSGEKSVREDVWVKPEEGEHIALICGSFGPITREERLKHANLIAAAPCMLEMIEALFCNPEGEPCFQGSEGDREYMRQVLKKARGEV